jgi:hypothetical protein
MTCTLRSLDSVTNICTWTETVAESKCRTVPQNPPLIPNEHNYKLKFCSNKLLGSQLFFAVRLSCSSNVYFTCIFQLSFNECYMSFHSYNLKWFIHCSGNEQEPFAALYSETRKLTIRREIKNHLSSNFILVFDKKAHCVNWNSPYMSSGRVLPLSFVDRENNYELSLLASMKAQLFK